MVSAAERHQGGISRTEKDMIRLLIRVEALLERIVTQLEELNRKADEMETE